METKQEQGCRSSAILMAVGSTELSAAEVPDRVLVVPWGEVASSNGSFVVESASAAEVVAAFEGGGNDLPIDYEHQTLGGEFTSPDGRAPAAGWIKTLEVVEGQGIFANVEWTDRGRGMLSAKEYRYLSPVALVDRDTRRMVALHSAALTNKPAIAAMQPIVNAEDAGENEQDKDGQIEIASSHVDRLRRQLDLDANASADEVLVCAARQLDVLTDRVRNDEAETLVVAAQREGKLTASQRAWALSLAMRDAEGFEAWRRGAPVVVQTGRLDPPGPEADSGRRARAVINQARSEFRRHETLRLLTGEEAYIKSALREAGLNEQA